jgi:hypothetical protein
VYLEESKKGDKKPTEAWLTATIDTDEIVVSEQRSLDTAEVLKFELERLHNTFENAHILFRGFAKNG